MNDMLLKRILGNICPRKRNLWLVATKSNTVIGLSNVYLMNNGQISISGLLQSMLEVNCRNKIKRSYNDNGVMMNIGHMTTCSVKKNYID